MQEFSGKKILPSIAEIPTIYETPTVYETGAGGGGISSIKVDGIDYDVVKIGNRYFTTENLRNTFSGEIPLTGSSSDVSCRWVNNNEATARANKYNLLYTIQAIAIIENHLTDGWRVAKKTDYDFIAQTIGKPTNNCSWGTNYLGFSLVKNGNGSADGNSFFNVGTVANMRIENGMCSISNDFSYSTDTSETAQKRFAAIRLCKDVE